MDKEIEENIKFCVGCAIEAKSLLVKFTSWAKTDRCCSRLPLRVHDGTILFKSS